MEDLFKLMVGIGSGPGRPMYRDTVAIDGGHVVVDTCVTPDLGPETAILCRVDERNQSRVVARYDTVEEAEAGHARVVKELQDGRRNFRDPGYGELQSPFDFVVQPREGEGE